MQPEDDIDDWAERVAGRAARPSPSADAARRALLASDAAAVEAGAGDALGRARLLRRLEAEGLLDAAKPAAQRPRLSKGWLGIAAAAGVAAVALTVQLVLPAREPVDALPDQPPPVEAPRGFAGVLTLAVADPAVETARVSAELQALGFAPQRLPSPDRLILEFDVPAEKLEAFRAWAEPRGARVTAPGRWRVIIDPLAP